MLHVVDRLGRELHGEFLRPRRLQSEHEAGNDRQSRGDGPPDKPAVVGSAMLNIHAIPPSRPIYVCPEMDANRFGRRNSTMNLVAATNDGGRS